MQYTGDLNLTPGAREAGVLKSRSFASVFSLTSLQDIHFVSEHYSFIFVSVALTVLLSNKTDYKVINILFFLTEDRGRYVVVR